jgi:hypothetical protein
MESMINAVVTFIGQYIHLSSASTKKGEIGCEARTHRAGAARARVAVTAAAVAGARRHLGLLVEGSFRRIERILLGLVWMTSELGSSRV